LTHLKLRVFHKFLIFFLKQLEAVFNEVDKMESDYEFMKVRMIDEMNLGLFLVDTKEYKEVLMSEIRSKISFAKKILREKF